MSRGSALMLLLAGCAGGGEARRVAPLLAAIDRHQDGVVDARDWDALAYAAPPFTEVDRDHDGGLDAPELVAVLRGQDPKEFDRDLRRHLPRRDPPREAKKPPAGPPSQRELEDALAFLAAELRWAGYTDPIPGPSDDADPLAPYRAAYEQVGLPFPTGLPGEPGTRPRTPAAPKAVDPGAR